MSDLIAVTTTSVRLRHYADPADANTHQPTEGWMGSALCDKQIFTDVYDQAALDADRRRWGSPPPRRIADLPPCKRCAKKAAALLPSLPEAGEVTEVDGTRVTPGGEIELPDREL